MFESYGSKSGNYRIRLPEYESDFTEVRLTRYPYNI